MSLITSHQEFSVLTEQDSVVVPANGSDGDGGEPMPIWLKTRIEKIDELVGADFDNLSSFEVPDAVVPVEDWTVNSVEDVESLTGVNAEGMALQPDGSALTGQAEIFVGDDRALSRTVSGGFNLGGSPPPGVFTGEDVPGQIYDFRFLPATAGVALTMENQSGRFDTGVFQYGSVEGTVENYAGDPVPNQPVVGLGAGDTTGEDGQFELLAPGGTQIELESLDGTHEFSVSVQEAEVTTVNFRFPRLSISVVDADFQPVAGAPITVDDQRYYTDEEGQLIFDEPALTTYDVVVQDYFEAQLTVDEPGTAFEFEVGPNAGTAGWIPDPTQGLGGVDLTVIDSETGEPIRDVTAVDRNTGVRSKSHEDGKLRVLSTDVGEEFDVLIGTGDKRYKETGIHGETPEDEMQRATIELEPQSQSVNY